MLSIPERPNLNFDMLIQYDLDATSIFLVKHAFWRTLKIGMKRPIELRNTRRFFTLLSCCKIGNICMFLMNALKTALLNVKN